MSKSSLIKNAVTAAKDRLARSSGPNSYAISLSSIERDQLYEHIDNTIAQALRALGLSPSVTQYRYIYSGIEYSGKAGLALALVEAILGQQFLIDNYGGWVNTPENSAQGYLIDILAIGAIEHGARQNKMSSEEYKIANRYIPDIQFEDPKPGPFAQRLYTAADNLYLLIRNINNRKADLINYTAQNVEIYGFIVPPKIWAIYDNTLIELKGLYAEYMKLSDEMYDLRDRHEQYMLNYEIQARNASDEWRARYDAMKKDKRGDEYKAYKLIEEIEATKEEPVTREMIERIARNIGKERYVRTYAPENFARAPKVYRKALKNAAKKYSDPLAETF
jgi:hypothetical protein